MNGGRDDFFPNTGWVFNNRNGDHWDEQTMEVILQDGAPKISKFVDKPL